jgi:hypothetical protein
VKTQWHRHPNRAAKFFAATKLFTAGCGDKPLRFLASHE